MKSKLYTLDLVFGGAAQRVNEEDTLMKERLVKDGVLLKSECLL